MPQLKKPPGDLIATIVDAKGRTVWITQKSWNHIQAEHSELGPHIETLKRAIAVADTRTKGNRRGTEKLWARNLGVSKWFTVVIAYEGRVGLVRTAMPTKKGPKPGDLI